MGIPVLILGESGTGKTCSIRNFDSDDLAIFNVGGKPLPFKKEFEKLANVSSYSKIQSSLTKVNFDSYVIDDSQLLMAFEFFDKASIKGYDKFTEIAVNFRNLIKLITEELPEKTIVYMLHHTEVGEYGNIKAKTLGRMVEQQITIEALFPIVLRTKIETGEYKFSTNSNGNDTCKSPMGMFDETIGNDLKMVDDKIREYYNL